MMSVGSEPRMHWDAAAVWAAVAVAGTTLLPWHLQQDGLSLSSIPAVFGREADSASALVQAIRHGRWWFWPIVMASGLAVLAVRPGIGRQQRASWLLAVGLGGVALIALQGWFIGPRGWSYGAFERLIGDLGNRQFGVGLGGALSFLAFAMLLASGLALRGWFGADRFIAGAVVILAASITLFTVWPVLTILGQVLSSTDGEGVASAFAERLFQPKIWSLGCLVSHGSCGVAWNSLWLAAATATLCTLLGLSFALVMTRTGFKFKAGLRALTVLPIITPPFVIGLGLILIFGRSGVINQAASALFGIELGRWIYGFSGIWLAQAFSFTPTAFLVLIGVVQGISPTMEEASETLGADASRTFANVTLPLMRPGLANAWLVVFIESLADFGNPILLGGSFGVLSTEVFFAVVGAQADFGRAGALALVLLSMALAAFFLQRHAVGRRSYVAMTGKGDAGLARSLPVWVRRAAFAMALPWAILTIAVYLLALAGGFVKTWGRDWTLTLTHYAKAFAVDSGPGGLIWSGGAWKSLFNTLELALIAAPLTAALGLLAAWLLARQKFPGRGLLEFALMLSFCVPGTVIGVAYILTFNVPPLELTGTATILVLCFMFRNLPVGVRAGMAAMTQLDKSLDEASLTLGASTSRTLSHVMLPLLRPAIVTALVYSFVRAMTTVSAVIFLVSAQYEMATVFIINRAINGDYGLAIAYSSVLIVLMMIAIVLIQALVGERQLGRRVDERVQAMPQGARA